MSHLYTPNEGSDGTLKHKRIRYKTKESHLLEIAQVENELEKKIIRDQSKKNKGILNSEMSHKFRVRDDESICQVCNSGDYQQYNLIVFCEGCGA